MTSHPFLRTAAMLVLAATPIIAAAPLPAQATTGCTRSADFRTMKVGQVTVVALSDGTLTMPFDQTLVGISPDDVRSAMERYFLPTAVPLSDNGFLIEKDGRRILIDTGGGSLAGDQAGCLSHSLAAAGYRPADITDIILTHFHFDHAGGLVKDGRIAFPNATLHVARAEAAHFFSAQKKAAAAENQRDIFAAIPTMFDPWRAAGRIRLHDDGDAVIPGVTMLVRPGHTPGETVVKLDSDGQTMAFMGDLLHSEEVQFAEPGVAFAYDENKDNAIASRRATFAQAADKGWWLAFSHLSFPGIGHIRRQGQAYAWVPTQYGVGAVR